MRIAVLLSFALSLFAQQPAPCSDAEFRRLDFWVGTWDVTTPAGQPAGTSRVERAMNGCVILEHWKSAKGPYEGMSLNTFDPAAKRWTQHYVDNGGLDAVLTGAFTDKALVYERSFAGKDGTPARTRMTFFDLGPRGVRQLVEQSEDGGKSWSVQYDLRYQRTGAAKSD